MALVPVSVSLSRPENEPEMLIFSLDAPASGVNVSASGSSLIFQRGGYDVTIHLPVGNSGDPQIEWLQTTPPVPQEFVLGPPGETSIQIGLQNELTTGTEFFAFALSASNVSRVSGIVEVGPAIVSDPPPTIEFRSS